MAKLFQIFDLTAQAAAGPIMLEKREGPAIRSFSQILADERTLPGQYPESFDLLLLGTQDEESCVITALPKPEIVMTGAEWVRQQKITAAKPSSSAASAKAAEPLTLDSRHNTGIPANSRTPVHG